MFFGSKAYALGQGKLPKLKSSKGNPIIPCTAYPDPSEDLESGTPNMVLYTSSGSLLG